MTVQELEQALLQLSFREKLRIIQMLLKQMSGLWTGNAATEQLQPTQASPVLVLERLAKINTVSSIKDPLGWQQEQREDRPMSGREL